MRLYAAALVAALSVSVCAAQGTQTVIRVQGGPWRLAGRAYESDRISAHPHLVVVLHGDAPGINPFYQYLFARRAAAALDDAVVVGLLRPGYGDGHGGQSQGDRGWALADNYTPEDVASIASAIRTLKARYHAIDVTMVGHSGGSTISADILALYPRLAQRALLVSCPCDVPAFRMSMLKLQWNPLWLIPVNAVSPQDNVARIPRDTIVRLVVGGDDPVAPPWLTFRFANALKARGDDVRVMVLKGKLHDILLEPEVLHALRALMTQMPKSVAR